MPKIHRFALVPYTPQQMFDLVRDVDRYPEFLAWVRSAEVHESSERLQRATLEVQLGGLTRRFTTRNEMVPGERLSMRLDQGPFEDLAGCWQFQSRGDGCRVSLDLTFHMGGSVLLKPFQRNFSRMADHMVDDFSRRAESVYG